MQAEMRNLRKDKYAVALVITIMVFTLGFLLGNFFDDYKRGYVQEVVKQQELEFTSLQLQYLYLESIQGTEKCPTLYQTLENNIRTLAPTLNQMLDYEKSKNVNSTNYLFLKRQYLLSNLKYWLLSEEFKKTCSGDSVTVLYFFSNDCKVCLESQGVILSNLKQAFENKILIFAIDSDFINEPMVILLKNKYNITKYPTLIINDKKVEQFLTRTELLKEICPQYIDKENQTECSGYY
ncbi:MAG: hypothetical protein ABIF85_00690 [Nanoarchaeota archaeon]|nr:hypothetical protein [Nanoarchaeota archaeon]MBU4451783.1 hypothetical protein [Nanoarchaeota archaeon]MCG2723488.1 hypothetical protein [archaeon]